VTPEERQAARETEREIIASVLRTHRTGDRARIISVVASLPCWGFTALIVRWHAWPWLAVPVAVGFGIAFAAREVQKHALERHRRACAELGVTS
jgi:hypothetical protein